MALLHVEVPGFLEPMGIAQNRVAAAVGAPPRRINEIVHGKRRVTAVAIQATNRM